MIAMRMRDQNSRNIGRANGQHQSREMRLIRRAGIDDDEIARSDEVGAGAGERERPRIGRDQAPDSGCDLLDRACLGAGRIDVEFHIRLVMLRACLRRYTGL